MIDTTSGDQFVRSNIVPKQMTSAELHDGYRSLLRQLYDWRAYEDRTVAFLRHRGAHASSDSSVSRRDLRAGRGVAGLFLGRHGWRRAWFSWRTLTRVVVRRPSAAVEALSFIVMHKAMHDYTARVTADLAVTELGRPVPAAPTGQAVPMEQAVPVELATTS